MLILLHFRSYASPSYCVNETYESLKISEIFLFYAMSKGNSFSELNRAEHYLNIAEIRLKESSFQDSSIIKIHNRITALRMDIDARKKIGVDNLNYRYPFYDLITGKRGDYNFIDDAHELLLETILQRMISQTDPANMGPIRDAGAFALVLGNIEDRVMYNVIVEFLSENTNHYVFQLFELEMLGYNLQSLASNISMRQSLLRELVDSYKLDELYIYEVNNLAKVEEENLYYSSCELNRYDTSDDKIRKLRYVEDFRSDRNQQYIHIKLLFLIVFAFAFICIFIFWVLLYDGVFNFRSGSIDIININNILVSLFPEYIFSVGVSFLALLASVLIHHLLLNFFAPPTTFHGDSVAILSALWVIVGVPISLLLVVFIIYRFRNTDSFYRRNQWTTYSIVSLVLVAGYASLLFIKSPSDLNSVLLLLASITVVLASFNLCRDNRSFQALKREHLSNIQTAISLILIVTSIAQLSRYDGSEILQGALLVVAGINMRAKKIFTHFNLSQTELKNNNPGNAKSIFEGITVIDQVVEKLLNTKESKSYYIQMPGGSGKTSLLRYLQTKFNDKINDGSCIALFADSNKVVVNNGPHESLREAFSKIGLDTVIYNGSNETAKAALTKGLGAISQIDENMVGAALSWLSPIKSYESIVSTILAELKRKSVSKLLLIIDDYHILNQESDALVDELIKQSKLNHGITIMILKCINESSGVFVGDNGHHECEQLIDYNESLQQEVLVKFLEDVSIQNCQLSTNCKTIIIKLLLNGNGNVDKTNLVVLSEVIENMFKEKILVLEAGRIDFAEKTNNINLEDFAKYDFGFDSYDAAKRQILQCAACMGRVFDKSVLSSVLGINAIQLIDHLDVLERNKLIIDEPELDQQYRFKSDTIRQQILKDMSPGHSINQKKRDYHQAIFNEIENRVNNDLMILLKYPHLFSIILNQLNALGRLSDSKDLALNKLNKLFEFYISNGNTSNAKETMKHLVQLSPNHIENLVQEAELELETSGTLTAPQYENLLEIVVNDKIDQENSFSKLHVINLLVRATGSANHESKKERLLMLEKLGQNQENAKHIDIDAIRWRFYLNYFIQPNFYNLKTLIDELANLIGEGDSYKNLYWELINAYGGSGLIDGRFNVTKNCEEGIKLVKRVLSGVAEQLDIEIDELIYRLSKGEMGNLSPKTQKTLCYTLNYLGRGYMGEGVHSYEQAVKSLKASVVVNNRVKDNRGLLLALSTLISAYLGNSAKNEAFQTWLKYVELIPKGDNISLLFGLNHLLSFIDVIDFDDTNKKQIGQLVLRIAEEVPVKELLIKFPSGDENSKSPLEVLGIIFEKIELPSSISEPILQILSLSNFKEMKLTQETGRHMARHFSAEGIITGSKGTIEKMDIGSKFNPSFAASPEALIALLNNYKGNAIIRGIENPKPETLKVKLELEFDCTTGFDALVPIDSIDQTFLKTTTRDGVKCFTAEGLDRPETKKVCIVIVCDLHTTKSSTGESCHATLEKLSWILLTAWPGRYAPPLSNDASFWKFFAFVV